MRLKSCKFFLTASHCRHETSPFVAVVGWVFDQFHCTIHHVNMYPQYWTPSIGGTYQNRKAEAAAQKYGAAASAFYLLRPLRVPTVPFRLIPPLRKGVFARRICGQAFPGMAVRFAEKSYSAREKAPEDCFGHLFRRFLPILQCFLQKRLYK